MTEPLLSLLSRFTAAWNARDVDALMACMTPDGTYAASSGGWPDGATHEGAAAVRQAYADLLAGFVEARWENATHFVRGDRGVSEWTFRGAKPDGERIVVRGCDLFTFRHGLIARKDSFRKAP